MRLYKMELFKLFQNKIFKIGMLATTGLLFLYFWFAEVGGEISTVDGKPDVDGNEIIDMAKLVYKGMRANFIKRRAEEIVEAINSMGLSYPCLTDKEKAELFRFLPDDNNYNLELHMAVLKD